MEEADEHEGDDGMTVRTVLEMSTSVLGNVICEILANCPHYSSKKSDTIARVCKYFGIITRGGPRRELDSKLARVVLRLRKNGVIEEYKAKNVRIRLLNPPKQQSLL